MSNTVLFFVSILVIYSVMMLIYKLLGKTGIFAWVGMAVVVANILVCKCVNIFNLSTTLGNIVFSTIFLSTDILTENHGVVDARKAIKCGVAAEVVALLIFQLALRFVPNELDIVDGSFHTLFELFPRTTLASLTMFILSNQLDIYIYNKLKTRTCDKYLFIRNNVATIISQCIENFFFYIIAFLGIYSMSDILFMTATCCIIEIIVALLDTPFIYFAKFIKEKGYINEN